MGEEIDYKGTALELFRVTEPLHTFNVVVVGDSTHCPNEQNCKPERMNFTVCKFNSNKVLNNKKQHTT